MFRIISVSLGSLLIALGVVWFFTPVLDGIAISISGQRPFTALSKMYLGDAISMLFAGLSITGAGLVALGIFSGTKASGKDGSAALKGD